MGCDSNADQLPDIADLICTLYLALGQSCGETSMTASVTASLDLAMEVNEASVVGRLSVPTNTAPLGAIALRLHYDPSQLQLDPTDSDGDGVPDALRVNLPEGVGAWVQVDNEQGEVEIALSSVALPVVTLPASDLVSITFSRLTEQTPTLEVDALSAGSPQGVSLPLSIDRVTIPVGTTDTSLYLPNLKHQEISQ